MIWANLLHFYQPQGQKREIIDAIVAQCYRPVAEGILARPSARLSVNFTGVLLDQLAEYGHQDVIELWKETVRRGQVELVASAKYHVILPLIPLAEARRQIEIHNNTNRTYFGDLYQPKGIFLPEMAWSPELAPMIEALGIEWVMLDELAKDGHIGSVDTAAHYGVAGTNLGAIFREHRLSATIMSATTRTVADLKQAARVELTVHATVITGMDGETFGHHRTGHEQLLFGMMDDNDIAMACLSEVAQAGGKPREMIPTLACTWASSADDLATGTAFISWHDPANAVHGLQWKLLQLACDVMARADADAARGGGLEVARWRAVLDYAISSDQFFWASARPWWMIEHIERGAFDLSEVVGGVTSAGSHEAVEARRLYHEIVDLAYAWQRSGKIDDIHAKRAQLVRIPYKKLTKNDQAAWKATIELLHTQELASRDAGDYETAILWRDGAYKLEHALDIYDAWYILDILRTKLPEGAVEQAVTRYRERFDQIRGGQVEQRSN